MKRLYSIIIFMGISVCASSQALTSSYFLDHDNYRFRINPSFMPDDNVKGYFGMLVDNLTLSPQSNFGLSSFLFPVGNELVTGFNKQVPAEKFLGGLSERNILDVGVNANLMTIGFRTDPKGFASVELNLRSNSFSNIPKSLFSYLKLGSGDNTFVFDDLSFNTSNYVELAMGYSRRIGECFQLGARVKLIGGAARADMIVDNATIKINAKDKQIEVSSNGTLDLYSPIIKIGTKITKDGQSVIDFNSLETGDYNGAGFGVALDFGVSCSLLDNDLELSAAVQDLGFINWKNTMSAQLVNNAVVNLSENDITEKFSDILNFKTTEPKGNCRLSLPMTLQFGAKYSMPFYKRLKFGIIDTYESSEYFRYNDLRLGMSITPIDQISFTANYGFTSYGNSMGLAINFNLGPIQLFAGADGMIFEYTPQFVPIKKLNTTFSAGLLLQFKNKKLN